MSLASRLLPFALAAALPSCLGSHDRGEPLYPVSGPLPAKDQVAQLGGFVRQVDGKDVTEGRSFELLPGCHVVVTPKKWGHVDSSGSGGVLVDTGRVTFALVMKPGHTYLIEVQVQMMGGSVGSAVVQTIEGDGAGNRVAVLHPAASTADIDACKEAGSQLAN
jgi:hypothetical protein